MVAGTDSESTFRFGLALAGLFTGVIKDLSTKANFGVLTGVPSKPLAFLVGEVSRFGSTFSESKSSVKELGEKRRLVEVLVVSLPDGEKVSWRTIAI